MTNKAPSGLVGECVRGNGTRKNGYSSHQSAKRAAQQMTAKYGSRFLSYRCSRCFRFHVANDTRPPKFTVDFFTREVDTIELGIRSASHLWRQNGRKGWTAIREIDRRRLPVPADRIPGGQE
jgi:hypothetical protein